MRFTKFPKFIPKGVTKRRIASQKAIAKREQYKFPLLSDWVEEQQLSPEEIIKRNDDNATRYFARLRSTEARLWREVRSEFFHSFPPEKRTQILSSWKRSNFPGSPLYFRFFFRCLIDMTEELP